MDFNNLIKHGDSIISIYNSTKRELTNKINSGPGKNDVKNFQKMLQSKFYGDTEFSKKLIKAVQNVFISEDKSLQEKVFSLDSFDSINFSGRKTDFSIEDINLRLSKFTSQQKQVYNSTSVSRLGLKEKISDMEKALSMFKSNTSNIENGSKAYEKIKNDIEGAINNINELLNNSKIFNNKNITDKTQLRFENYTNTDLESVVNAFNDIYFKYILPKDEENITTKQIGDIFEYGLGLIAYEGANGNIDNVTSSMLSKFVTGSKKSNYNNTVNSILNSKIEIKTNSISGINSEGKKITTYTYKIPGTNVTIKTKKDSLSSFNPYSQTQIKQDVIMEYPSNNKATTFKISAKNWANANNSNNGFEVYNLAYSLYRIIGEENFFRYIYTLSNNTAEQKYLDAAHKTAYLSMIADSLIGFAQQETYANVLVVNDRASSTIIVASMKDIVKNITKLLNEDSFSKDYSSSEISKDLKSIYNEYKQVYDNGSFQMMRAYISEISTRLKFSALVNNGFTYPKKS